jgi:hypothetical protein
MTRALPIATSPDYGRKVSKAAPFGTGCRFAAYCSMPRYFFHVYHERDELEHEGEELPDKHAAWEEATVTAGQILQGLDGKLQPDREWRMEVMDEFQNPLYVLHINAEKPK